MTRESALTLIDKYITDGSIKKHLFATEAIMKALANRLREDEKEWALTGLLHDLDYMETKSNFEKHGFRTVEILKEEGFTIPNNMAKAIIAHACHPGWEPQTLLEKALYATDPLSGLVVAAALIHPDKKLSSIDTTFIMKRFKEKRFAAGADRNQIKSCESFGLTLEEFISIGLIAMSNIAEVLGL
ncbi:MAG: HDIG domain-containing protein [Synergistetes bacterium]|nr:HDIG domain-containing protein [Synergistota bacterium]MCX8128451.1 HDIG domain-containing protein [Synergistota bacterium]MDW8193128.1 HDIG domain-containing protein [Synergistota bacterium]